MVNKQERREGSSSNLSVSMRSILGSDDVEPKLVVKPVGRDQDNKMIYKAELRKKSSGLLRYFGGIAKFTKFSKVTVFLEKYLHWTFRTSFISLFATFIISYASLTLVFSLLLLWAGNSREDCMDPSFKDQSLQVRFINAFQLSWATDSTVGYGKIAPATRGSDAFLGEGGDEKFKSHHGCLGISFICSLESFVGIIFSGVCGAIMFGKAARVHSAAPVVFSDTAVIRFLYEKPFYVNDTDDDYDECEIDEENSIEDFNDNYISLLQSSLSPILEFRVVNRLCNHRNGGEINDASIMAMARVLSKASPARGFSRPSYLNRSRKRSWIEAPLQSTRHLHTQQPVSLEMLSATVKKYVYKRIVLRPSTHPFFENVWRLQHNLNEHSPLLSKEFREKIRANHGVWTEEMRRYENIRKALIFEKILCNFSGNSTISASAVYVQQLYEKSDLIVGYQFSNMMYHNSRGKLCVDLSKINDVNPQKGVECEPLLEDLTSVKSVKEMNGRSLRKRKSWNDIF